jgi:hypothetical protein
MHVLAQVDWEQAGVLVTAVIAAVGGKEGLQALIVAWRAKRGNGRAGQPVTVERCGEIHAALAAAESAKEKSLATLDAEREKRQEERHKMVLGVLCEVKEGLRTVHRRVDELMK